MRSIYCLLAVLLVCAQARRITFNDPNMPITVVETSIGQGNHERVTFLSAEIHPHHVTTNQRINFPTSGPINTYFVEARAPGDERGHLVGSQFSGPAQWYNLSPQNARVNRNAAYQSINTDWYGSECEVRRFLDQGGNRHVIWNVHMTYTADSNRPNNYLLRVDFIENGRSVTSIDTNIQNPFQWEDSRFWICRQCRSNTHVTTTTTTTQAPDDDYHDELLNLRRRREITQEECTQT